VDLPEKERAKIRRDAAKLVKTIEATRTTDTLAPVAETVGPFVFQLRTAREVLEAYRKTLEKQMVKLAKTLPVWSWVANVQGLGELGLAIIVGEAGDLGNYANPGKLWKRMGLAPKEAYADVTLAGKDCHKIPRRRRSAMWTIGDAIVKQGYGYRELYLTRKEYEHEQHPEPEATGNGKKRYTPMHLHRRAQRYMEKRVLRDLLNAWSI